jgi:hypothetical protein
MLEVKAQTMNFRERKLYHQIHPLKLATDIGVTPISLYFLWRHWIAPAIVIGFVPPVAVSVTMMIWPPDLERLKRSVLGQYISKYMTPTVEVIRFLSLVPMAWGAWIHNFWVIVLGLVILLLAWCSGVVVRHHS